MNDPHETMYNAPDPAWDYWSEKLIQEAEKEMDEYYESLFQETESKMENPF